MLALFLFSLLSHLLSVFEFFFSIKAKLCVFNATCDDFDGSFLGILKV